MNNNNNNDDHDGDAAEWTFPEISPAYHPKFVAAMSFFHGAVEYNIHSKYFLFCCSTILVNILRLIIRSNWLTDSL